MSNPPVSTTLSQHEITKLDKLNNALTYNSKLDVKLQKKYGLDQPTDTSQADARFAYFSRAYDGPELTISLKESLGLMVPMVITKVDRGEHFPVPKADKCTRCFKEKIMCYQKKKLDGTYYLYCIPCNEAGKGYCSLKTDKTEKIQANISTIIETMSAQDSYFQKVRTASHPPTWDHINELQALQEKLSRSVLGHLQECHPKSLKPVILNQESEKIDDIREKVRAKGIVGISPLLRTRSTTVGLQGLQQFQYEQIPCPSISLQQGPAVLSFNREQTLKKEEEELGTNGRGDGGQSSDSGFKDGGNDFPDQGIHIEGMNSTQGINVVGGIIYGLDHLPNSSGPDPKSSARDDLPRSCRQNRLLTDLPGDDDGIPGNTNKRKGDADSGAAKRRKSGRGGERVNYASNNHMDSLSFGK